MYAKGLDMRSSMGSVAIPNVKSPMNVRSFVAYDTSKFK